MDTPRGTISRMRAVATLSSDPVESLPMASWWSAGRDLALSVALTAAAAGIGFGVSWVVEPTPSSAVAPSGRDAVTLLAYSRSSARVSGDFGAP